MQRYFFMVMKLAIALLLIVLIYKRIKNHETTLTFDFNQFNNTQFIINISIVFVLMIINWSIETIKWRYVIRTFVKLSYIKSFCAVLCGTAVSFFTPNRIGEFLGRLIYVPTPQRINVISVTLITNIAQLAVTLASGIISIAFCFRYFIKHVQPWHYVLPLTIIIFLLVIIVYFRINQVLKTLINFKFISDKYKPDVSLSSKQLFVLLSLSTVRYGCFCLQFLILLFAFGCIIKPILLAGIALQFLLLTIIPSFTITELPVRLATASLILSELGCNVLMVIQASFFLWLINLAIPSIAGVCIAWFYKNKVA
jgi:hypothetical protein